MWFKNLLIYRLTKPTTWDADELEQQLDGFQFTPCGSQDISKQGFVKPLGKVGESLVHSAQGNLLLAMEKEEKILPASVVREEMDQKVSLIEDEQGRKVTKKEKDSIKEEIIHTLLPRAFSRRSRTRALVLASLDFVIVEATSHNKAEELLSLLRKAIGSLPIAPVSTNRLPEEVMTEWVTKNHVGEGFTMLDEATLKSPLDHGGSITMKQMELSSSEVTAHIEQGLEVTKIALEYRDVLSLVLDSDLSIKRLKFSEEIRDQNNEFDKEELAARLDADFALMCGELTGFLPDLFAALGGQEDPSV
ncbi:recombination-associated protein RdgC [Ferrimonas aestuarii]|uniref:Recombination-associated protein RdgC n=1 Tax=Ferrimonas aestuarii TaxID=2569539 RepID=A0A4U1BR62_9GAMM|nr:recombination-associated protein RdgC [Ferrimonas aestuarii]TKB56665.1 recombination-associated protein RdgC [Ferrimonas aestuarii]